MVARICVLLLLSGALSSCGSAPAEELVGREFGPLKILLYAQIREGICGWLGDRPLPAAYAAVTYSYSANFKELDHAIAAVLAANGEGTRTVDGRHKAVRAIVTARRINRGGIWGVQILSSQGIEIVDLPTNLYDAWKATSGPPN